MRRRAAALPGLLLGALMMLSPPRTDAQAISEPGGDLDSWLCFAIAAYDARDEVREGGRSFLDLFEDTAFFGEYCPDGGRCELGLRRFARPVRLVLDVSGIERGDPRFDVLRDDISYMIRALGVLTGLDIDIAGGGETADPDRWAAVFMHVRPTREIAAMIRGEQPGAVTLGPGHSQMLARRAPCWTAPHAGEDGETRFATIVIRAELEPDLLGHCVIEELYNSFGIGDPTGQGSIFADPWGRPSRGGDPRLAAALGLREQALMRLLHRPELRPGMTRREAMPILRELLAEGCG